VLFPRSHSYNSKFIIPTAASASNCAPYTCKEPNDSMLYQYATRDHRVKDVPANERQSFKDFSSLEEIKQLLRDDPSFFTRLAGLENLRRTSPAAYGRSLRAALGRAVGGRRGSRRLDHILARRFRRDTGGMVLRRPAVFDRLSEDGKVGQTTGLGPPSQGSPVQYYSAAFDTSAPSRLYTVPAVVEAPSDFYSVPATEKPLISFFGTDSLDPAEVADQLQQEGAALTSSVAEGGTSGTLLQTPPAIAAASDSQVVAQQLPAVLDILPLTSVVVATPSSAAATTTFDRNSALLTALGLSLIPTLAISIPFLAPAFRRRGRDIQTHPGAFIGIPAHLQEDGSI
jgi:hypothetical protein